ncbi:MAG: energy transducer TonB [Rhodoferax sp.]|nr:energy transducer TonB [Rhodoferax sp.]
MALAVSFAVHAVLLTVRFVDPQAFNRVFQDTPLEVILVNARSDERPQKAMAIAQASLAGGGEADKGRATSPLPPSTLTDLGETMEETQRRMETMQEQQAMLLAQVSRQLASMPLPDPKQPSNTPESQAQEEKRRQLVKLLAEIERRINQENSRPKRRYVSPATREEVYAVYYDSLRRRVEDKGTENFPEANGKKLYGELTMIVTVNHDGQVLATQVVESSGNRTLDRRAEAIARSAGPYGRFSAAMRAKADEILVVSRFRFTRDQTLETKLTGNP